MDEPEPLFPLCIRLYNVNFIFIFFSTGFFRTATIFAYGQTSSGKTYTMSGITEFTIADIYDYIEKVRINSVNKWFGINFFLFSGLILLFFYFLLSTRRENFF